MSRLEMYNLEGELARKLDIDISEAVGKADNVLTYLSSIESATNTSHKIEMMRKSEKNVKEIIQFIVSKINPDTNPVINLDERNNGSYRWLVFHLGRVVERIELKKQEILNQISNRENISTNKITNQIKLDSYASYMHGVLNDLFDIPLKESFLKFFSTESPIILKQIENSQKTQDQQNTMIMTIKKDKNFFWFLVFAHLFRSSQIIGCITDMQNVAKPFDVNELKRLVGLLKRSQPQIPTGAKEENLEVKKELKEAPKLKPENLYFPKVNGATEPTEEEYEEQEEFEDEEGEEEDD